MVEINGIMHSYSNTQVLTFNNWLVEEGDRWTMLGSSGSGKTTLLHIISGLLKPTQGDVLINDIPIYQLSNTKLDRFRGKNIGLVFQRPHLLKSMTVAENLILAQSLAGLPTDKKRVDEVLFSLNILNKRGHHPSELSQGQLQRVAIARAVVNKPALLIADEPTSSLDDLNTRSVLELLISQAKQNGSTLIVATHDYRVKESIANSYEVTS